MAEPSEVGTAVWGIEVGGSLIRAVRLVRRTEGGVHLLAYREERVETADPAALVTFLRRRRLARQPLVIAIHDPGADLKTVSLPPELMGRDDQDLRMGLIEYVHPEPEQIDLRFRREDEDRALLLVLDRARIESFLVALERADVPCYALVSDLDAILAVARDSGLFKGDGVIVRVLPGATDILFLDGPEVGHLGLPVGGDELVTEQAAASFATDVMRLVEYRRSRFPRGAEDSRSHRGAEDSRSHRGAEDSRSHRGGEERIALLGLDEETVRRVEAHLPVKTVPFPSDASPIRGKGRIRLPAALELVRHAPGALGAAWAGVAEPRRLDLAFRPLPAELPSPRRPAWTWIAAAALLWAALGVAWLGTTREVRRLAEAAKTPGGRAAAGLTPEVATELRELIRRGRLALALPVAVERTLAAIPGPELGPYRTGSVALSARGDGGYAVEITLLFPGGGAAIDGPLAGPFLKWKARFPAGTSIESEVRGGDRTVRCRFRPEERR